MSIKSPANPNYCAMVTSIQRVEPINGADRIQIGYAYGNPVIISTEVLVGSIGVYFPVETELSHDLVSSINGYRKKELGNKDQSESSKTGFFDESRRVKCLKLRQSRSEGIFLDLSCLSYTGFDINLLKDGMDFDELNGVSICRKYVPKNDIVSLRSLNGLKVKKKISDMVVDRQWNFHYDTSNLRRNVHRVFPGDDISLSWKCHGTSAIFSKVLIQKDLKWYEKILVKFGVQVQAEKYGYIWSSRKVVKGIDGVEKPGSVHYYGEDVWGSVASRVESRIPKGYTVYGEIVGFTPSGGAIQSMGGKPYDYGCGPNECKLHVYRVTITNVDGIVVDMPFKQMVDWCHQNGFETVPVIFYGKASEFLPVLPGQSVEDWQEAILRKLETEYVDDRVCHLCKSGVVQEGIVLRTDFAGKCEAKKLKAFRFLAGESADLDTGVMDMETAEAEAAVE